MIGSVTLYQIHSAVRDGVKPSMWRMNLTAQLKFICKPHKISQNVRPIVT